MSHDAQRGMYCHPTLCITPERIPLGVSDAWMWFRYWKRTRYSLKKKRDEQAFEKARQEIEQLVERDQKGEIELAYVDEAKFMPQPPNRSAWTKRFNGYGIN